MSTPKMYTWRDADAPTLIGEPGSLIQVLRKCLVEGFGSGEQESTPPGAGWEMQVDDPPNRAAFRSLNPNSAGHWYYFDDAGDYDGAGNNGAGTIVAALIGAETFTGWDTNGDPELTGIFGANGTLNAQYWLKSADTTTERGWIVIADDRTCYFFAVVDNETAANAWDIVNGQSTYGHSRGLTQSVFGDYQRFDQFGGATANGVVLGDNRTITNTNPGALTGVNFYEATPATSDDITDAGSVGALVTIEEMNERDRSGGLPSIGSQYVGPLHFERHWIGQQNATARKGSFRGLRVVFLDSTSTSTEATFPDIKKLYGQIDMGAPLGEVFYLAGRSGSASGFLPYCFVTTDWDEAD